MVDQTQLEAEVAELLVEALNLEDVKAIEIEPDLPLFDNGLGLDSIDALEIALAISQKYNVQMQAEEEHTREAFSTLRSLSQFIAHNQA